MSSNSNQRLVAFFSLLTIGLLAISCGFDEADVRRDFYREHPNWSIQRVYVGEGDAEHVYVSVVYHKPGDTRDYREERLYVRSSDGWNYGGWKRETTER